MAKDDDASGTSEEGAKAPAKEDAGDAAADAGAKAERGDADRGRTDGDEGHEAAAKDAAEGEGAASEPPPAGAKAAEPASDTPRPAEKPIGAAWGHPIARFERGWTWLESRLITFVLVWQLLSLVAWVLLSGASSPVAAGNSAGAVFRMLVGGIGLGIAAWVGTRAQKPAVRRGAALAAIAVGFAIAPLWRTAGVQYFENVKAWLQEGSMLTLMGGLRGLGTRLTLWLALLGASLATASGKHINIDVIYRFLPIRLRLPAALVNSLAASLVCFAAVWGFFDHIAIVSYGAKAEASAGEKIAIAAHHLGESAFLTRKQLGLDLQSLPHVMKGQAYLSWMSAKEWNDWVKDGGFDAHFTADEVKTLLVPETPGATHAPLVIAPDGSSTRGMLVHDLNFVFPFGMLVIGLRFLLRVLLMLSGHISLDPDAAHKEELGRSAESAEENG